MSGGTPRLWMRLQKIVHANYSWHAASELSGGLRRLVLGQNFLHLREERHLPACSFSAFCLLVSTFAGQHFLHRREVTHLPYLRTSLAHQPMPEDSPALPTSHGCLP